MLVSVMFAIPNIDRLSSVKQISANQVLSGRNELLLLRVGLYPGFHRAVLLLFAGKTNSNLN